MQIQCKRCLIQDEQLRVNIRELLEVMPPEKRTSAELYSQRLQICAACNHLIKGTCVKCGCYVELRAAKNNKNCPEKHW